MTSIKEKDEKAAGLELLRESDVLKDNFWIRARVEHLLGSMPVPASENTDKQKWKEKTEFMPSVSVSLLVYNRDNTRTQNALYSFWNKSF